MQHLSPAVELWVPKLKTVRLPHLSEPSELAALLDEDIGLDDVHRALAADLPLGLEVLLQASADPRLRTELRSLQHGLNVLGLTRVQSMIRTWHGSPLEPERTDHQRVLQGMLTSRFAAHLLHDWLPHLPGADPEYLKVISLLLGVARWKLPLAAPTEAEAIERAVRAGKRRGKAEREVLGCTLTELNMAHLLSLGLSPEAELLQMIMPDAGRIAHAARQAWTGPAAPGITRDLARWMHQPTAYCSLAYLLAQALMDDWYGAHALTLQKALSAALAEPLDQVMRGVRRAALAASHETRYVQNWPAPILGVLAEPTRVRSKPPRPLSSSASSAISGGLAPSSAAPSATDPNLAPGRGHIRALKTQLEQGKLQTLAELARALQAVLRAGLHIERALLLRPLSSLPPGGLESASTSLQVVMAMGYAPEDSPRGRRINLKNEPRPDLLLRLLQRPNSSIQLNASQRLLAQQQLPSDLIPWLSTSGVWIGSMPSGRSPNSAPGPTGSDSAPKHAAAETAVAILWVDGGVNALPADRYEAFRALLPVLGPALAAHLK